VERFEYIDFRLKIGPRIDDNCYVVMAASDISGEASGKFCPPFSETELENFVLKVGLTRHRRRGIGSPEWETARAFGQRLFEAVFTPDVRACFASSRTNVQREDNVLRIRLTLDGAELFNYPWEFMYDSSLGRFLTLYEETPLVRYIELPMPVRPLAVKPPLRLLVMISNPNDYPRLDVERERSNLTKALSDLKAQGLVTVDWLDEANLELLSNQLLKQNYHIFHFIGHGGFDQRVQDGLLILKSASGYGEPVSGERLAVLLGNHRTLRLVVLNACEGARTSPVDPFAGAALTLVRAGNLPVVVAMQFEITDTAAIAFARGFYSALAAGRSVDAAVIQARLAIFAKGNDVEWGTPVLYMRSTDSTLFSIQGQELRGRQHGVPVIRFSSGEQATSVIEWVNLAEQHWGEATKLLYDSTLETWLAEINEPELAPEAERIRHKVLEDPSIGLEQFQRLAGSFKLHRKDDAVTNLDNLIGQLIFWKMRKQKMPSELTLEITNRSRGYMHGVVISKVPWIAVPHPRFGCLIGQTAEVDIGVIPAKRRTLEFSPVPLDFSLE
jgi:hypothetical protein